MSAPGDNDNDDRDDPMLRSMRAMWVSMRDQEPPSTGLDALLAAARTHAARMQPEKPSWWQQLLVSLRRPPVLALATVVVLMGGAIVIGGHRDKLEVKPSIATQPEVVT